ncbi:prepilin-type N-terminal cleavage/methylation domain-containing protein [Massilia sp. IC2-278]|uniref:prepilin-type N-terminal cleavage/methylation domain-containing protein n=1 Tax=Massilia sp. IC2-278 TaxID=2887200 RepID=UPI001E622ECF|nr:prepilin-type N-terminal cleavage/methylation domain-containing protein [Massilia sp. IC2-278]MCC2960131.1 prepilin-type N-terminal cleavage/methylation domain-containing protein [Massilia sp. IC2-278]
MTTIIRQYAAKGFTLIELLIVVIIIAILAAIAIPQFSNTSGDAQESAALANLTTMRSAIELYRVQHNGRYPSKAPVTGSTAPTCPDSGGGSTADNNATTFTDQLTKYSSLSGHTCATAAAGYSFGPYIRAIPSEPITGSNAVVVATAATATPTPGAATVGWRFVNDTGTLQINSSNMARDGTTALSAK